MVSIWIMMIILNIFIIIIIINFITTTTTTPKNNLNHKNVIKDDIFYYDCKSLTEVAEKKNISSINSDKRVNCNSNIIECQTDNDCQMKCLELNTKYKRRCGVNGICTYNDNKSDCKNGGFPTTYFYLGRIYTGCICNNDNFIGRQCQISNLMKRAHDIEFELIY